MGMAETFESRAAKRGLVSPLYIDVASGVDPLVTWLAMFTCGEQINTEVLETPSGVSKSSIKSWFCGSRTPNIINLRAVLNTLGYDIRLVKIDENPICQTPTDLEPLFPQPRADADRVQ
jgi:hypothetical protein